MLQSGDRIGLVACSNPLPDAERGRIDLLCDRLSDLGLVPVLSDCLFAAEQPRSDPDARAAALMRCYADGDLRSIFDLSGGDLANELLSRLDWALIRANPKPFWGYSDLTVLLNAIWQMTGQPGRLFQLRTLVGEDGAAQTRRFSNSAFGGSDELFSADWRFVQGEQMEGILVGGNLRCLLKLAGTRYLPDFTGRLLFLEGLHGGIPQLVTHLSQLKQMEVFDRIAGLMLGTFTQLEETLSPVAVGQLVAEVISRPALPIAKTQQVGHGPASRCLNIGGFYRLTRD